MIAEVIRDGRMPPWGATGPHGIFANDPRLTADQEKTILTWMEAGMPEGDPADLPQLSELPADGWLIQHMHLRGKSAEVLARYPDGKSEALLIVPRYDFGWQHRYDLARPKHIPGGTEIRMAAVFDNSASNPTNLDPSVAVRDGWRTTDEMCQTYLDVSIPYVPQYQKQHPQRTTLLLCGASVLVLYCGLCMLKRQSLKPASG